MRLELLRHPRRPVCLLAGLLLVNITLALPALALPVFPLSSDSGWREIFTFVWLSADLLVIIGLLWLGQHLGRPRVAMATAGAVWLVALVSETYDVFITATFNRRAVLYNDLLLLPDAFNLALDLAPGWWLAGLALAMVASVAVITLGTTALRRGLEPVHGSRRFGVAMAAAIILAGGVHLERGLNARDSMAQSSLVRLGSNLVDSLAMRRALADIAPQSRSDGDRAAEVAAVRLRAPPDVFLIVIESYGSILHTDPTLAPAFARTREAFATKLEDAGWRSATAFSDSPVTGGMSWLASASLLAGMEISNQHIYERLISAPPTNMPAFFAAQGYRTLTVQPANRERPGRPLGNPFGFATTLFRAELAYRGRPYGWGVVPDQYSLNLAREAVAVHDGPTFLYAATVSSHAPWDDLPELIDDWQSLNEEQGRRPDFWSRLSGKLRARFGGGASAATPSAYLDAMAYELGVLGLLIGEITGDHPLAGAVFILIGDHQPPFFYHAGDSSTPVHVITRDPALLAELAGYGFAAGLDGRPRDARHLRHSGLYSLLVHSLAKVYGTIDPVPEYLPEGAPVSVLYPRPR